MYNPRATADPDLLLSTKGRTSSTSQLPSEASAPGQAQCMQRHPGKAHVWDTMHCISEQCTVQLAMSPCQGSYFTTSRAHPRALLYKAHLATAAAAHGALALQGSCRSWRLAAHSCCRPCSCR